MKLKKANAVLAFISILILIAHIVVCVYSYIAFIYIPELIHAFAETAAVCIIAHAAVSLYIVFTQGDGFKFDKYPARNIRTHAQRISGLLMIPSFFVHFRTFGLLMSAATSGSPALLKLFFAFEAFFFAVVLLHSALSLSKAFITLGLIVTEKALKKADIVIFIVAAVIYAVAVYSILSIQAVMILG